MSIFFCSLVELSFIMVSLAFFSILFRCFFICFDFSCLIFYLDDVDPLDVVIPELKIRVSKVKERAFGLFDQVLSSEDHLMIVFLDPLVEVTDPKHVFYFLSVHIATDSLLLIATDVCNVSAILFFLIILLFGFSWSWLLGLLRLL